MLRAGIADLGTAASAGPNVEETGNKPVLEFLIYPDNEHRRGLQQKAEDGST